MKIEKCNITSFFYRQPLYAYMIQSLSLFTFNHIYRCQSQAIFIFLSFFSPSPSPSPSLSPYPCSFRLGAKASTYDRGAY
jgi:hypothetical protein